MRWLSVWVVVASCAFWLAPGVVAADDDSAIGGRSAVERRWAEASAEERKTMRARLRARLAEASPREQRRLARRLRRLERALPEMSSLERLVLLRAAADLPEKEQAALRERIRGADELEPAGRAALIADLREMIDGLAGEADRIERNRERWRGMSEAERETYRSQMKRLRALSPEEREELLREMERRRGEGDDAEE